MIPLCAEMKHEERPQRLSCEKVVARNCSCGAIFKEAGSKELTKACEAIGRCKTGNAVITPGFNLSAKYIIHAVGPRRSGGNNNEPKLLYSAYKQELKKAKRNDQVYLEVSLPKILPKILPFQAKVV